MGSFINDCYDKASSETKWVVITPFDYYSTNEFLQKAAEYNIDGIIIQYDDTIEAAGYYASPELIAIISSEEGRKIKPLVQPITKEVHGKFEHEYITHCQLLTTWQGYYAVLSCLYMVVSLIWIQQNWSEYGEEYDGASLQKTLSVIPVMKLL